MRRQIFKNLSPHQSLLRRAQATACATVIVLLTTASQAKPPVATLSSPPDNVLVRANIPVFGTAYVPGDPNGLQNWRLEYGPGRSPKEWSLIKESSEAVPTDPWASGQVKFNPNWGAHGNLTDWSVGLTAYAYATWRNNLNGIYTLRLTATSKSGEKAEVTRLLIVGEAILRTQGGTANSADLKCHILFQPFSFGGFMSMVVAIVRQVHTGSAEETAGIEETGANADRIYEKVPSDLRLLSPIYRIYPNGMIIDPAAVIQLECPSPPTSGSEALVYLWNPVPAAWEPLATNWHGNTAVAKAIRFPEYETYVAVLSRTQPLPKPSIAWNAQTALSGAWQGRTEPFANVSLAVPQGQAVADENGVFSIPSLLKPGDSIYRFEVTPRSGDNFKTSVQIIQHAEATAYAAPQLSLSGPPKIFPNNHLYLLCEDLSLPSPSKPQRRSLLATVRDNLSKQQPFNLELLETIPGSGRFACSLDPADSHNPFAGNLAAYPHNTILVITLGPTSVQATVIDQEKPLLVMLDSATHPCGLYLSQGALLSGLKTSAFHDQAKLEMVEGAARISGISDTPSARIAYWPIEGVSPHTWPLIGFTYKLFQPSKWQLQLSSNGTVKSFPFGTTTSWFPPYSATDPLITDGKWHRWQSSLLSPDVETIDSIFFGSWLKGFYLVADPAFRSAFEDILLVRDLWVGKGYADRRVAMRWKFTDASPLHLARWWIDTLPDSPSFPEDDINPKGSVSGPSSASGTCQFTIPIPGQWFFHVQAEDDAGNFSNPSAYPLYITGQIPEQKLIQHYTNTSAKESKPLKWEQPNGSFQIKLPGLGPLLDPKSVVIRIAGENYPCPDGHWNASNETLTIFADSFPSTAPMGLNNETLTLTLTAHDLQGHPLEESPSLTLQIQSPFTLDQSKSPYLLKIATATDIVTWRAYWKDLQSPWHQYFPSQANNNLVIYDSTIRLKPIQWERPIKSVKDTQVYFIESFDRFEQKLVSLEELGESPVFDHNGFPNDPDRSQIPWGSPWALKISSDDSTQNNCVRMAIRNLQHHGAIDLKVASSSQIISLVDSQLRNQDMRIDGWLPPGHGMTSFAFPPDRSVRYATSNNSTFSPARANLVSLEASESWTRFTILISTSKNFSGLKGTRINGTYAW
jgi:hypothetical protein